MELANLLCRPNGPSAKKQVAEALGLARGSLYIQRKQAQKDKRVANAIEAWHEKDDTMGHRKLGKLLHMGKNRVRGDAIPDGFIRLSVGCEDTQDLLDDIAQAFAAVSTTEANPS